MTNIAVVYCSRYGSTKQYAQWLAEDLGADLYDANRVYKEKLETYDMIVFGGGLYYGRIKGLSKLKRNYASIRESRLVVLAVGLTPPENKKFLDNVAQRNFSPAMRKNAEFFYLVGAADYDKLSPFHKLLMKKYRGKKPAPLCRESLAPIEEYVRSFGQEEQNKA